MRGRSSSLKASQAEGVFFKGMLGGYTHPRRPGGGTASENKLPVRLLIFGNERGVYPSQNDMLGECIEVFHPGSLGTVHCDRGAPLVPATQSAKQGDHSR
jgi:hypothetical protein